jgi:diguanylate cyclase (GGDEF)-like protein/PAS domain S-box-containing protein
MQLWALLVLSAVTFFAVEQKVLAEDLSLKRVLILNSYHSGYAWSDNIMRGVFDVFFRSGLNIEPYVEYMDMKRVSGEDYVAKLKALYQTSFKNIRIDAILVSDNDAFDFMRKYRDELFPGVPVVFCGVNDFHDAWLDGWKDITGVVENNDYQDTLALALKLGPKTRHIVVVTDNTTTGRALRSDLERIIAEFREKSDFVFLSLGDQTAEELVQKLKDLKEDSAVLLLQHYRDKTEKFYSNPQMTKLLTAAAPVPSYVVTDTRIGFGALGGKVVSGYAQGESAAEMVVKILNGTDVNNIPILRQSPNKYVFDWRVMRRFRVPVRVLPGDSIIINRPASLFAQYRIQFITAGGAFVLLVMFNIVMFFEIRRRKRAEKRARDMAREWQNTFDAIKDPISIHDKDFNIVRVNKAFADMFGLSRGDVIGKKCFGLLHGCNKPPEQCPHLQAQSTKQPVIEQFYDQNIKRHIEISVWPRIDKTGNFLGVVHAFRDVTERIEMERTVREAGEKLKSIFRAAPTGIGVVVDWVFKEANDRLCEMVGYSKEELIGQSSRMIYPSEEEFEYVGREKYRQIDERGTGTIETHWQRKDGQVIDILLSSTPLDPADLSAGVTFTALDITERKQAEESIRQTVSLLRATLESTVDGILVVDSSGKFTDYNQRFVDMWRLPADIVESKEDQQALAFVLDQLKAPHEFIAKVHDLYSHPEAESFDVLEFKDGRVFERYSRPQLIEGNPAGRVWCFREVTERKRFEQTLAEERNLLRMLIDNIPDSIYVKDREGRKTLTNQADLDFMGVNEEGAVLGKTDSEVYPPHLSEKYNQDDQVVLQHGRAVINREEMVEDAAGLRRWLLTSKLPIKDGAGQITGLVGIGRDITERKHLESRLLTMAHYDTLTKLPNRTLFFERSNTGISQARRTGVSCAVLFVDLDHFKSVNDTLGHTVGDELLKDTAARLSECVREMDTIARLGGDEFIIFLNGLETAQGAQHIAERIREKFNTPRQVSGNDLFITASIGIATFPHDGDDLEELLKNADAAMYAAKDSGRNAYCFFDAHMNQKAVTKMQIERGLRDALAKSEFRLFYQPIVGTRNGKIRGFEALLRWFRSEGGLITPNEFIPVAEDTGLIVPIGEWVLYQACRFNKRIIDAGFGKPVMSVNISVAQLRRKNIVDAIRKALQDTGLPPECLEVEVTESILIQSFDAAVEVLKGIRDLGVQVSLDDFGTGYSSLSHLQRLPIANLKIDRLFVKEIGQASEENDLTPAIIELAHKLKLKVVAEGVETDVQLERLARDRCDYFQGFLFCKPMPEDRVFSFLEGNRSRLTMVSGR